MGLFQINGSYKDLLFDQSRYIILKGSAGSGKSVFASQKVMYRIMTEEDHRILGVRKVARTIEASIWTELLKRISESGQRTDFEINKTLHRIRYLPTGSEILCIGIDDPEKIKSISQPTSAWVEEATELSEADFNQLDTRIRGDLPNYKQMMLTFNPVDSRSWVKKKFFDEQWPKYIDIDDNQIELTAKISETTFRDNKFITEEDRAAIVLKGMTDPNFHRVYYLGEWGVPEVDNPFLYTWDESRIDNTIEVNPNQTLYVSIDFNVDPITASVHQFDMGHYYTLDEFRIKDSNTESLCEQIKGKYGHIPMRVTGDASGNSRRSNSRLTDWQIVKQVLNPMRIDVLRKNPSLSDSRTLSNSIMAYYPNRKIHPRCEYLIEDFRLVRWKDGKIDKSSDARITHLLDTQRYMDNTYHNDFIKVKLPQITRGLK